MSTRVPARLATASNLDIALSWVALGCRVHPVSVTTIYIQGQPQTIKTRLTTSWTREALNDPALIRRYWEANPDHMVGVIPGSAVFVLDVDRHGDKDGFKRLTGAGLSIPVTYYATTPSGGEHHFYRAVAGVRHDANLMYGGNILEGVDRRCGDGSYFHAYSLAPDPLTLPDAPSWALGRKTRSDGAEGVGYSGSLEEWLAEHGEPIGIAMSTITNNFPAGDFDRSTMLRLQTRVVLAAVDGWAGGAAALDLLRDLWLAGQWNTPKYQTDWGRGPEGAVSKYGGKPEPVTLTPATAGPEEEERDLEGDVAAEKYKLRVKHDARLEFLADTSAYGLFNPEDAISLEEYEESAVLEPLIEGVLERGTVGMLYADSYVGKSYVSLDWALSVAMGLPWCGRVSSKAKVLYLAMEGASSMQRRWKAWCDYRGVSVADTRETFTFYHNSVDFTSEESHERLTNFVRDGGYELVIVDMSQQAMGALDENSPSDVRIFMNKCIELREASDETSVLFLHHSKKDDVRIFRGGGPFYGMSDFVWLMTRVDNSEAGKADPRRVLESMKWKTDAGNPPKPINLDFIKAGPDSVLDAGTGGDPYVEAIEDLRRTYRLPITKSAYAHEVAKRTGKDPKTHANRISRLISDGVLQASDFTG